MKVLAIGDPHFMVSNLDSVKIYINKMVKLAKDQDPDFIVVLGDLLHTHEKIHSTVLRYATRFLRELSEISPVYLIIGNHDMNTCGEFLNNNHAFNSFKNWENLTVCDRVKEYIIEDKKFVFCPYVPPGRFKEALDTLPNWETATAIFAHQEFLGCRFNPVAVSEIGDPWDSNLPLVISGHIHDSQWVNENIFYPGSSIQHAFGESADKTVVMITFKEKPKFKKYNLGMRKKKIVYLELENIDSFKPDSENEIKLVLKGTSEEFKTFRKSKKYHELTKNIKVSFIPRESTIHNTSNNQSITRKKSVVEILKDLINDEPENVKKALDSILK